ncbi:hypothetical protein NEOLEDRAFT_558479 [Neolentinus lepideus HHB14362 ss-1]|uniref:Uncharacterized protein n=1 Tax=Neolentinus lepideus HHB14362 ss-1 TaxID=1314782 RepID=A0A165R607_9AGAM|nr:hypothetical protein NEOLEDRAFT_558479 [Neolentinus lepideus HHB14362 ss-1]
MSNPCVNILSLSLSFATAVTLCSTVGLTFHTLRIVPRNHSDDNLRNKLMNHQQHPKHPAAPRYVNIRLISTLALSQATSEIYVSRTPKKN